MKIGFNITSPESYTIAKRLAAVHAIDFAEILVDNFTHLDPQLISDSLHGLEVGFHIMKSEFIERDTSDLKKYSSIIRSFSSILKPLYISDHLARFNIHKLVLPITAEINYENEFSKVSDKVTQWQDMLQSQVILENFPSRMQGSSSYQVCFFEELISKTKCGLLFDLSNAVVAQLNGGSTLAEWLKLRPNCNHFHVAGYRTMGQNISEQWIVDSHDCGISEETLLFAKKTFQDHKGKSIVIERDSNLDYKSILTDIESIRKLVE